MCRWEPIDRPLGNDIGLLRSGNFADGTIECQGRTWKVHRALLSSRLKFFKAAFTGEFAEAASRKVNFPEATPDSVNIMLRHLYGEELDTIHLETPLLCVHSWKLADYLQLESLKQVATWALEDHLDAMALLASNNEDIEVVKPIWFGHFVHALREVCTHSVMDEFQNMFVAFLWVTRFRMLLPQTLEILNKHPDVNNKLLKLLAWKEFEKAPPHWFPESHQYNIEHDIHNVKAITINKFKKCAKCGKIIGSDQEPRFYNPFPFQTTLFGGKSKAEIGQVVWCKRCVDAINELRSWPWQWEPNGWCRNHEIKLKAWSWSGGK